MVTTCYLSGVTYKLGWQSVKRALPVHQPVDPHHHFLVLAIESIGISPEIPWNSFASISSTSGSSSSLLPHVKRSSTTTSSSTRTPVYSSFLDNSNNFIPTPNHIKSSGGNLFESVDTFIRRSEVRLAQ